MPHSDIQVELDLQFNWGQERLKKNNPWLEFARFSTSLRIQDTAEFGKGTELHGV